MNVDAGELRHRVRIERPVYATIEETGERVKTWELVANVWAAIQPLSVREFIAAQATQSAMTARIKIRYRQIEPTWRFVHRKAGKDMAYNVVNGDLSDKDSGLEYLTVPVSTGVNDGE